MKRFFKILLYSMLCCVTVGILFSAAFIFSLNEWKDFRPEQLTNMEYSLILYDENDAEYLILDNGQNRIACDYKELPEHVKNAFLAIEDARFFEHRGIDLIRIGGALLSDLKTLSFKEGASTITQQLVKLSVLTGEKSLARKTNEIIMALKTEKYYTKDEILEMYLNRVYFGGGAYGIEAAARRYFGIHAEELTIAQAAALAGIVQSPSAYAPHIHPENCQKRRDLVLSQMAEHGMISETEYRNAQSEALTVCVENSEYVAGYYTDYVLSSATQILGISMAELLSCGYKIETALDQNLQRYSETLMQDDENFPEPAVDGADPECAVIVEQSKTGLICALIGGREHTARLGFSRATDMKRQPGSAIKPILVFTPALEFEEYLPTSFLLDQPMRFQDYAPRNSGSSFRGWITLRNVIAYSVNIPTVALFEELGIENCKTYAQSVGIEFSARDNNLSLALGGFTDGITPLSLAGAYQPYANSGVYLPASPIRRILDHEGNLLYDWQEQPKYQVISEETAFLMSSMLRSSVEYGTAKKLYSESIPLSAKTGTTSYDDAENNKDAWICAFNPDYIVCTWMGFDQTDALHSLKKGETGGSYPALLTKKIFEKIYEKESAPDFAVPASIRAVAIDGNALENEFEIAAVPASATGAITEYFTEETVPSSRETEEFLYENDWSDLFNQYNLVENDD